MKSGRLTYELDFEPKTLLVSSVDGAPAWRNLDVTPNVEWSPKGWLDLSAATPLSLFDLGVRRAAADEGRRLPQRVLGALFEQFVGLELLRATRQAKGDLRLRFCRDPDGPEVDWVVEGEDRWLPVEVKWSEAPAERDTRHLQTFLSEYAKAREGVVACRTPRRFKLTPRITAVPWQEIPRLTERLA